MQAIKLGADKTGDLTGTDAIVWEVDRNTPYVPSPLLYGDKIYFLSSNNGILSCYQAQDGKPNYVAQKLDGVGGFYASPVGAGDKVYLASQKVQAAYSAFLSHISWKATSHYWALSC